MTLAIDHIVVCVPDLEDAVRVFEQHHGVASIEGGRHVGHGTGNRLVPLGPSYVELVAVVDEKEATVSPFGRWVAERATGSASGDAVCVSTIDIDAVCDRLGLSAEAMSRRNPDGTLLEWRVAGIELAMSSGLPFFIQWDVPSHLHPGRGVAPHPPPTSRLANVTLRGNDPRLSRWASDVPGLHLASGPLAISFDVIPYP